MIVKNKTINKNKHFCFFILPVNLFNKVNSRNIVFKWMNFDILPNQ